MAARCSTASTLAASGATTARIADVAVHDLELRMGDEVQDRLHAEHQAVEEDHLVPGVQQDRAEERSDVAGSAGDEDAHGSRVAPATGAGPP